MAAASKTNLLTDVVTHEVSLVDRGAVRRKFAFRKNEGRMDDILKACLQAPLEHEDAVDAILEKRGVDKKAGAAIKGAIKLLSAFKEDLQETHRDALQTLLSAISEAGPEEENDDEEGGTKKAAKSEEPVQETLEKADMQTLPAEIQAQFAEVRKAQERASAEAASLRKELDERKEQEHLRRCVEKASSQYADLGPAKVLGPVIQKLEKAGLFSEVESVLRGANARAKMGGTSSLFKEAGTSEDWGQSDGDNADARLQKAAVDISKTENVPMIVAHAKACQANPDLYEQYKKEQALSAQRGR